VLPLFLRRATRSGHHAGKIRGSHSGHHARQIRGSPHSPRRPRSHCYHARQSRRNHARQITEKSRSAKSAAVRKVRVVRVPIIPTSGSHARQSRRHHAGQIRGSPHGPRRPRSHCYHARQSRSAVALGKKVVSVPIIIPLGNHRGNSGGHHARQIRGSPHGPRRPRSHCYHARQSRSAVALGKKVVRVPIIIPLGKSRRTSRPGKQTLSLPQK